MKYTIKLNPNKKEYEEISKLVKDNDNFCPCKILKNNDTRCMCKEFQTQEAINFCHCGRYYKLKIYPIITLCGSTRFKDEFLRVQKELTLQGNIVLSVGLFGHSGDNEVLEEDTKKQLDDLHRAKIEMSDAIFVINKDKYIGESTKREIEWAERLGKQIIYLEE